MFIINIKKYSSKPLLSKYNNFIKLFKKIIIIDFIQILDNFKKKQLFSKIFYNFHIKWDLQSNCCN